MSALSIGLSALSVDQQVLDLIGQNIANANTPGYHRQVAELAALTNGQDIGAGVDITQFRRIINNALETQIKQNTFETGYVTAQLNNLNQLQAFLDTGSGSLSDLLSRFFNQMQQLSAQPDDPSQRQVLVATAGELTAKLNSLAGNFQQLQSGLDTQMQDSVKQVNSLGSQIASLNAAINQATLRGTATNDLQDQRDQLISRLSQLVDIRTFPAQGNQVNVLAAGAPLVLGDSAIQLQFGTDANGNAQIRAAGAAPPLPVSGGQLAGLLQARNVTMPDFRGRLDNLAQQLIQNVNAIEATGLGTDGAMTLLAGQHAVSSSTVPLANANLAFPPQAGTLVISVTNQATGKRTLNAINIDPATQSLQDVANAISGIGNIQAVVDSQTRTLRILAQPGYRFDFAGQLPSDPQNVNITGTATPQLTGSYTGATNDTYTFRVVGSGTVGVTANLALEVRNSSGTLLASENIGQGYSPGSPLTVNGVSVSLSAGTVNNGDSFSTPVVANPDTAGILGALGLGTFFSGDSAANVQVNQALLNDPGLLATSRTGAPGDNTNLQRMIALADQPLLANGVATLGQFYDTMVSDAGSRVQELTQQQTAMQAVGKQLQTQQQGLSGVDPNEELVKMLQYQRSFQLSARYITVVNEAMTDLLNIIP
jgi:flagellar hook-associated protein FlgK